ncbi:MAG: hypothetical protein AAFX79_05030 [Planctomycetota bacterium]
MMKKLPAIAFSIFATSLVWTTSGCAGTSEGAARRHAGEMLVVVQRGDEWKLHEARQLADGAEALGLRGLVVEFDAESEARPTPSLLFARRDEAPFELDVMLFAAQGTDAMDGWLELRETSSARAGVDRLVGHVRVQTSKGWARVQIPIDSLADAREPMELTWIPMEQD